MSSWNFRLIRWACGTVALHEAYYNDDGKVTAVTLEPISFLAGGGDEADEAAAEEIRRELRHAVEDATRLPILDCTEIPGCTGHRLTRTEAKHQGADIQGGSRGVDTPEWEQPSVFILRVGEDGLKAAFADFVDVWKRSERGERIVPSVGVSYPSWDGLEQALRDAGLESAEHAIIALQALAGEAIRPEGVDVERWPPSTLRKLLSDMPPRDPGTSIGIEPHDLVGRARYWAHIAAAETPDDETAPADTLWWALGEEIERLRRECAEAYQVIGALAATVGASGMPDLVKVLDNLAAASNGKPRQHSDVLPFVVPSKNH
ncbi:hypothetical protein [Azospirillum sp. TSO22-1]|uniref:hypothetical protein n=1 Tax=Azospirillum sp. TSO22-1 TaxID=716789 RepID=UPI0011B75287|nr:hypothetical protein [Azospirillum sp. TSO22-1]